MEKPGPWIAYPKVIDEPAIKSTARLIIERSVNVSLWLLCASWLLPAATVLLWILGLDYFAETLLLSTDPEWLLTVMAQSAAVLLGIVLLETGWIWHNRRLRRRNGRRRKEAPPCPPAPFGIPPEVIEKARSCRRVEAVLNGRELLFRFPGDPGAVKRTRTRNIIPAVPSSPPGPGRLSRRSAGSGTDASRSG